MNPLTEIISKLEKATGPSRYLDAEIAAAVGLDTGMFIWDGQRNFVGVQNNITVPHYTSSIDSALMLVPEGKYWEVAFGLPTPTIKTRYWGQVYGDEDAYDLAHPICPGATPAIALCVASLKAIAALRGDK